MRGDYAYIGEFYNSFSESGEAAGGYSQLHLKAGVELNQFDINLYINNVTNADDLTWVEQTYSGNGTQRAYRLRPRTIGLNAAYRF